MVDAVRKLSAALNRPLDLASLAFFRIAFGLALLALCARFFNHGWIEAEYQTPRHFFHYWGFEWVRPWPGNGMYVHYAVMAAAAACIALGVAYRPACVVFALSFSYAHLCDKANYLNHYYFISLVSGLMALMPLDREASLRVYFAPEQRRVSARAWVLYLLRFQVGVVYVFGGIGKLGRDWLLHAEPLRIWLSANVELPLLGRFFEERAVALAFSWAGLIFDLSVVPLLLWPRTRKLAYVAVVAFHVLTALLFKIGMFPWLMMLAATLFFEPGWPRPLLDRLRAARPPKIRDDEPRVGGYQLLLLSLYVAAQLLLPLRHLLYPGNTLWSEEGFRFAWRVMLIEKSGELELQVVDRLGRRSTVSPRRYLTAFQARMAATQPDMILELAHIVARDYEQRGAGPVQVFADARVSFNGRASAPLIAPTVDLARQSDGLAHKTWILPAPSADPEF
ncbi:MAG TPA: HTTM domain-containing protein [Polyangiaceae bacterium]|nr:HTTM domain-containing protein [Polyangiaceae bacterium]